MQSLSWVLTACCISFVFPSECVWKVKHKSNKISRREIKYLTEECIPPLARANRTGSLKWGYDSWRGVLWAKEVGVRDSQGMSGYHPHHRHRPLYHNNILAWHALVSISQSDPSIDTWWPISSLHCDTPGMTHVTTHVLGPHPSSLRTQINFHLKCCSASSHASSSLSSTQSSLAPASQVTANS